MCRDDSFNGSLLLSTGGAVPGIGVALQLFPRSSALRPGLTSYNLVAEPVPGDCANGMSLASALGVVSCVVLKSGVEHCTATSPEAQRIISTRLAYTGLS